MTLTTLSYGGGVQSTALPWAADDDATCPGCGRDLEYHRPHRRKEKQQ